MHFYWRVIEELKLLGETWIINDPSLARSYKQWVSKNAEAIARIQKFGTCETPVIFIYFGRWVVDFFTCFSKSHSQSGASSMKSFDPPTG